MTLTSRWQHHSTRSCSFISTSLGTLFWCIPRLQLPSWIYWSTRPLDQSIICTGILSRLGIILAPVSSNIGMPSLFTINKRTSWHMGVMENVTASRKFTGRQCGRHYSSHQWVRWGHPFSCHQRSQQCPSSIGSTFQVAAMGTRCWGKCACRHSRFCNDFWIWTPTASRNCYDGSKKPLASHPCAHWPGDLRYLLFTLFFLICVRWCSAFR